MQLGQRGQDRLAVVEGGSHSARSSHPTQKSGVLGPKGWKEIIRERQTVALAQHHTVCNHCGLEGTDFASSQCFHISASPLIMDPDSTWQQTEAETLTNTVAPWQKEQNIQFLTYHITSENMTSVHYISCENNLNGTLESLLIIKVSFFFKFSSIFPV